MINGIPVDYQKVKIISLAIHGLTILKTDMVNSVVNCRSVSKVLVAVIKE
jgi:hypothetical protein